MKHFTPTLIGAVCLLSHLNAEARPIPWQGEPFFLSSKGTALGAVLRDLGANYGLAVVVSDKINATYIGTVNDRPAGHALAELSRLYQLQPYYDGSTLYFYKAQEVEQSLLSPVYLGADVLARQLEESGLLDGAACQLRRVADSSALQLVGVPVCLSRVGALAKQLDEQNLNLEQNKETVALFPLKYASSGDTSYSYREQNVLVPGVVSVLREMVQGRALPLSGDKSPAPANNALPTFSSDARQNAVLVRDRKKNIGLYADLIAQLDRRPDLVEISVAIIDVDASDINELGVDWSGAARIGGGGVTFNQGGGLNSDSFSSVLPSANNFLLRLNALTTKSKAKIVSRPSVVTLDNVQAILDRNITFYTKVSSEHNAELKSVTAGTLMRVTPRIVHEAAGEQMLLTLSIQDGRQGEPGSQVEGLPQVQNAEIATQATLNSGQALLLGGFVQDEDSKAERKIPLLGDLPLIGGLFRNNTHGVRSVVRLFLIKAEPRTPSQTR